jgi:LPXTG-motif cell wall-anchored protein
VPSRRRIAAVLAVLAVGSAPAGALAQSGGAGDDQYVDPIGGNTQQQGGGGSNSSSGTSTGPTLSATPNLSASSSQTTPATPVAQQLPRTGLDAGVVAAIGLALVLAGAALRRRLVDERH